ncbi:hypothetical protein KEM48_001709 [Puccinia striiformis f. sp. tritici PST-130]|nr:hypothetical protein H4Q26_002262 [Puccinia striiformis f. sp. tritici PST-130]KAI9606940.1 hypothetical protein KEM48_001709 [Puccinia striiformis f. sp. tritici PST-130]
MAPTKYTLVQIHWTENAALRNADVATVDAGGTRVATTDANAITIKAPDINSSKSQNALIHLLRVGYGSIRILPCARWLGPDTHYPFTGQTLVVLCSTMQPVPAGTLRVRSKLLILVTQSDTSSMVASSMVNST